MHYTPIYNTKISFQKDEIEKLFQINRQVLDVTMRGIIQEKRGSIPQPRMIIGAEGTGKSWLLMAIRDLLWEVNKDFFPCYFDASQMESLPELLSITSAVDERRRIVLLADNIDKLFSQLSDQDQYALRGKLNTNGAPILICSATRTPKALTDYSSAFFDGFDIQYIDILPFEEIYKLLGISNDKQKQRVEKLLSITGKEIRNVMMVKNILSMSSSSETDLQILFDFIYESTLRRLKNLPPISQQIIANLASSKASKTLAEIRESTGIESSKLSPYITHLVAQGILSKKEETIRKSRYAILDRRIHFFLSFLNGDYV